MEWGIQQGWHNTGVGWRTAPGERAWDNKGQRFGRRWPTGMSPAVSPSHGAGGWVVEGDAKAEGCSWSEGKGGFYCRLQLCAQLVGSSWMCPLMGREITAQVRTEVSITECFLPCRRSNVGTKGPAVGSPSTKIFNKTPSNPKASSPSYSVWLCISSSPPVVGIMASLDHLLYYFLFQQF